MPSDPRHYRKSSSGRSLAALRSGAYDPIDKRTKEGKARRDKRAFMEEARERYELCAEADHDQAEREKSDLAFYAGEQWPEDVKTARAGMNGGNGLPPVPARPCLVINKVREPVSQVLSQLRGSDISAELVPADDFEGLGVVLDDREIELREGMLRRILRESQASNWIYAAAERAAIAGRGFLGVMTRFAPGKTMDQELYVTGWFDQSCVKLDPTHERKDGSDAKYGFIGTWIKFSTYKTRWPDAAEKRNLISSMNDREFADFGASEDAKPWFKTTGKLRMVYVVDYFYTVETPRDLCQLEDGTLEWKDELKKIEKDHLEIIDERPVIEVTVKWAKLDGANPEPLEETDWMTVDVPIIKVVGDLLPPYDDDVHAEGLVRPSRDSNQGFNAMASKLVEDVAYAPTDAPYVAVGQMEGLEKWWNLRTTRRLPAIPYNYKDAEGQPVGPPVHPNAGTNVQPLSMALAMFDEAVQTTSRRHDPSLGKVDPTLRSGRAIDRVVDQSLQGTSNFADNTKISVKRLAEILNNALYPVYGSRPGRLAKIVNGENKPQTVMIGKPYVMAGKRPIPAPDSHPQSEQYTLSEHANCNIAIKITRAYETRREEEQAMLGQIVSADPAQLAICGDLLFAHSDGPGSKELSKRYRLTLAPPIQAYLDAQEKGQNLPPDVIQKMMVADQTIHKAQQEIQELQQKIAAKETETAGKLQITREQEAHEDRRAAMDREVKIAVAEIAAQAKQAMQDMALFYEERSRIGAQIHETAQGGREAAHDLNLARHAAATDAAQSTLEHAQTMQQADQAHGHALEQGAQAAALAPEPATGGE